MSKSIRYASQTDVIRQLIVRDKGWLVCDVTLNYFSTNMVDCVQEKTL